MSLEDLRKRLERLNRGPIEGAVNAASRSTPKDCASRSQRKTCDLEELVPGQVRHAAGVTFYSVVCRVGTDWKPGRDLVTHFANAMKDATATVRPTELHAELAAVAASAPAKLLFFDLETCGFTGTPLFLIGAMYFENNDFHIEQLLARNYAEEAGILAGFGQLLATHTHLVSFNGKSFDWPFLTDRAAIGRVSLPAPTGHCDLLHHARRRFKTTLPDCKLTTLEEHLCGRRRVGDIPGSAIPAAYHEFVRTSDAREMRDVLRHNFLDLTTMAELLAELLAVQRNA